MRNLNAHPITDAEKIAILRQMIEEKRNSDSVGDITAYALEQIIRDVYKCTAQKEDIKKEDT